MSVIRESVIQEFTAIAEDGTVYELVVIQEYIAVPSRGHPTAEREGHKRIEDREGNHVNRIEKGVYEHVMFEVTLRSDDPEAP